ncbi:hypothetical protein BT69DRAFT_1278620 [Atractiella rhizophila]|nr:hypothetical protein BT69DRAFT_1278620 [Atractiella rhizophila]
MISDINCENSNTSSYERAKQGPYKPRHKPLLSAVPILARVIGCLRARSPLLLFLLFRKLGMFQRQEYSSCLSYCLQYVDID